MRSPRGACARADDLAGVVNRPGGALACAAERAEVDHPAACVHENAWIGGGCEGIATDDLAVSFTSLGAALPLPSVPRSTVPPACVHENACNVLASV